MLGNRLIRFMKMVVVLAVLLLTPAGLVSAHATTPGSDEPLRLEVLEQDEAVELTATTAALKSRVVSVLAKMVSTPVPYLSREERIRRCRELKAAQAAAADTAASGSSHHQSANKDGGRPSQCGNGRCQSDKGETCSSCPGDCGACSSCGDGRCDSGETESSCPGDCGSGGGGSGPVVGCGDGICAWPFENVNSCWIDCPCQAPPPWGSPICWSETTELPA